jgi:hypothetical protein
MEKIIAALVGLLFTFAVVGTAIASGEPTSTDRWWNSYYEGKYVASSYDGYSSDEKDDDHYYEKDGHSSDSHDGYHSDEKDD